MLSFFFIGTGIALLLTAVFLLLYKPLAAVLHNKTLRETWHGWSADHGPHPDRSHDRQVRQGFGDRQLPDEFPACTHEVEV